MRWSCLTVLVLFVSACASNRLPKIRCDRHLVQINVLQESPTDAAIEVIEDSVEKELGEQP